MTIQIFQKGFHFSQDGPGNRLVYHLQGCNLRCPWCANPEGLLCTGGEAYTVDALMDEVLRSAMLFFDGGGVTLTGGEATMQFDAVKEFLSRLRSAGIHTCMETNGTHPRLKELFPLLDLLIMDLKHYDPQFHRQVTGAPNEITIQNITAALDTRVNLALRIPLVGGFNSAPEDAKGFAQLLTQLGIPGRATLELLCYHEYGKPKYEALGMPYTRTDAARISQPMLQQFKQILSQAGIDAIQT